MYYYEFRQIGIDCPNKTSGNAKVVCPKCKERKPGTRDKDLSISYDKGLYKCHSAKCGWHGSVAKLKKEYSRPEWKNNTSISNNIVRYFESRGISQKVLNDLKVTTDKKGNIQFNYFRNDELINVKTRFEREGKKTFKQHVGAEKILYNINSLQGKEKAIIVEGEIDVLSWVQAGVSNEYGVVSVDQGAGVPGSSLNGKLDCFRNCADELNQIKQFYICTDKDAPGVHLQDELVRRLGEYRCFIVDLPDGIKDANEVYTKNAHLSEGARNDTLRNCLASARPVPVPGIHLLDGEMWELMDDYYENGRPRGLSTHFPSFDPYFTVMKGEITLITGMPNDGKSTFLRQIAVNMAVFNNWKWGCYVPEDFPADLLYDDLCHIYIGLTADKKYNNRMSKEQYNEARLFVRDHFYFIYPTPDSKTGSVELPTNEWINERLNFLKLKYGVNAYIKDPWNKIHHEFRSREDQYLATALSREKFFAATFDGAFYVAHPGKMYKNKEGEYPCPDQYDISGGAMWNNQVDNIIVVFRPNRVRDPSDKMVEIHTKKIKKRRQVGKLGQIDMYYEVAANRYYDLDDFNPLEKKTKSILDNPQEYEFDDMPF